MFTDTPEESSITNGTLGLIDLYYRLHDDAAFFCSRLDPLLALDSAPLDVDWTAWSCIWGLNYAIGESTPFLQIRRLDSASRLTYSSRERKLAVRRAASELLDLGGFRHEPTPAEILSLLHDAISALCRDPVTVTLSGGYDSRLLALVTSDLKLVADAWTTSPDDGRDDDVRIASEVASVIGIPHCVHIGPADDYPEQATTVIERLEHRTSLHLWMGALASELRQRDRAIVDGLAGDVLFKNLFVTDQVLASSAGSERRAAVFNSLSRVKNQRRLFAPDVTAWIEDDARRFFMETTSDLDGHPADATLAILRTRTVRGVACSPFGLFGPELPLVLPFVYPPVLTAALRVPLERKVGGAFYKKVLDLANSSVASIRSTNEPGRAKPSKPLALQSTIALDWLQANISRVAERVPELLDDEFRRVVREPSAGLRERLRWGGPRNQMLGIALFGSWLGRYGSRLSTVELPLNVRNSSLQSPLIPRTLRIEKFWRRRRG